MKKMLMALVALPLLCSCHFSFNLGNNKHVVLCKGEVQTRTFDLAGFDQIVINGSADLKYTQGNAYSVKVEANEEVFQYLDYRVDKGVLILETKDKVQPMAETFDIYVSSPEMKVMAINGAAEVSVEGIDSKQDLTISVNGSTEFELKDICVPTLYFTINGAGELEASKLRLEKFYLTINGAGEANISGSADYASFRVSGAGDIDARELICSNIDKSAAGAAKIRTGKD